MADERFAGFVAQVAAFHITDRAMRQAQETIERALRQGHDGPQERSAYLRAVERYFSGFQREARGHLRDVDRRLESLNQVQFNLTAERGVAVKRIEATQQVLAEMRGLEDGSA
jgi:hypothetical protein